MMMPFFFTLLPADLQRHILQEWIGEAQDDGNALVLALSALDVACCRRSLRRQFLQLSAALNFSASDKSSSSVPIAWDIRCYMTWLQERKIAVTVLFLTAHNMRSLTQCTEAEDVIRLDTITTLFISISPRLKRTAFLKVVRACPGLTAVHGVVHGPQGCFTLWSYRSHPFDKCPVLLHCS